MFKQRGFGFRAAPFLIKDSMHSEDIRGYITQLNGNDINSEFSNLGPGLWNLWYDVDFFVLPKI